MKNVNEVNLNEIISKLEELYEVDNVYVQLWEDEECRDLGIATDYMSMEETMDGLIKEVRNLIEDEGCASAEITDEEGNLLYFIDDEDEKIIDLKTLNEVSNKNK